MKTKKNIKFYMLFVFFSNLNIMSSFLSLYLSDIGLSLSLVSSVFLLYQATKFLLEVPTGYVADRYGRKFSGILGMILMILSYLLLLTMNNQAITAYIFVFIQALGYTFISGSVESLFVDSIDNELLVHWNAVERIIFYFALALSSVMGGIVIHNLGYSLAICIDIFALFVTTCTILLMKEKKTENISPKKEKGQRYKLPVNQRNILFALYLIDFAKAFSYVGVQDLYALYLQQFGLTSNIIGIIIAFQFVISSLFGLLTPNLQKYMRNETLLYVLPAIQVIITIPAYALNINVWIVPFLYILQSIIFSLYAPVKYQLFQKNLDTSFRARALSFQSIMISMGSILFYGFSSIAGRYLALSHTVTIALVITLLLILVSSGILSKSDF
ncbi:MFS transporter [Lachnospiraceae bacterium 38-14]|uniref:MFS transporter n=1 Tax=Roseburia sp. 1XD42-69 TaxID=2320088 RepID=UPI0013140CD8|nr:MFS transporter [Roseburia sp. 1XD42-69]